METGADCCDSYGECIYNNVSWYSCPVCNEMLTTVNCCVIDWPSYVKYVWTETRCYSSRVQMWRHRLQIFVSFYRAVTDGKNSIAVFIQSPWRKYEAEPFCFCQIKQLFVYRKYSCRMYSINYLIPYMYVLYMLPLRFNNKVVFVLTLLSKTILHL